MPQSSYTPLLDIAFIYDGLTNAERDILHLCLLPREEKRQEKVHEDVYPGISRIAKEAKCGTTTVKTFNKKMEKFGKFNFVKKRRVLGRKSNTYYLTEHAREFLILVQACRFQFYWKRYSKEVIQGLAEDEHFLAEKLYKKGGVIDNQTVHIQIGKTVHY